MLFCLLHKDKSRQELINEGGSLPCELVLLIGELFVVSVGVLVLEDADLVRVENIVSLEGSTVTEGLVLGVHLGQGGVGVFLIKCRHYDDVCCELGDVEV